MLTGPDALPDVDAGAAGVPDAALAVEGPVHADLPDAGRVPDGDARDLAGRGRGRGHGGAVEGRRGVSGGGGQGAGLGWDGWTKVSRRRRAETSRQRRGATTETMSRRVEMMTTTTTSGVVR